MIAVGSVGIAALLVAKSASFLAIAARSFSRTLGATSARRERIRTRAGAIASWIARRVARSAC